MIDDNITTNDIVDTLTYKYIYSIDKLDKFIHGNEYTVKCLEVCAFNVVFRLFAKGSRMMNMLFAHNYVGLRNSPDGLPTLFIIGEKSPLKIMEIIKDYRNGVFRLSDIAENWCCAAAGPNAFGWKEPKDEKMKKAHHKYLHNYKRKETNYEQLKAAHRTFDRSLVLKSVFVINLGVIFAPGNQLISYASSPRKFNPYPTPICTKKSGFPLNLSSMYFIKLSTNSDFLISMYPLML